MRHVVPDYSIGWDFQAQQNVSVDLYEGSRQPRRGNELVLPRTVRQTMLKEEWGVKQHEIASAVRSAIKTKNNRRNTVMNLGKITRIEEGFESFKRKMKRALTGAKRDSKMAKEWKKDSDHAAHRIYEMEVIDKQRRAAEAMENMNDSETVSSSWSSAREETKEYFPSTAQMMSAPDPSRGSRAVAPKKKSQKPVIVVTEEDAISIGTA
eukprot:scaffold161082_cov53-Attheya_sp.AAC.2